MAKSIADRDWKGLGPGLQVERRSQWIVRRINEHIENHALAAGAKIPSEHALAQRFGVSRAIIREAIAMLRAEGRLETVQGSGAFVTSPRGNIEVELDVLTRSSVKSLIELIGVRRIVEGEIAALAALAKSPDTMAAIDRALDRLRAAQRAGMPGVAEDRAFHASIADACGNDYWRKVVQMLARSTEIGISVTRSNEASNREFYQAVDDEHGSIRDAIANSDPQGARDAAQLHMDRAAERTRSADKQFWTTRGVAVSRLSEG